MRTWWAAAGGWHASTPAGTIPAGMVPAGVPAARVAGMVHIINIKVLCFGHHARGHEKRFPAYNNAFEEELSMKFFTSTHPAGRM